MSGPSIGALKARHYLTTQRAQTRDAADAVMPEYGVVSAVSGDLVAVRLTEDSVAATRLIAKVAIPVSVGDVGLLLPIRGGSHVFIPVGAPAAVPTPDEILFTSGSKILSGSAMPEDNVVANAGDIYIRTGGGSGSIIFEKAGSSGTADNWNSLVSQPANPLVPVWMSSATATSATLTSNNSYAEYIGRANDALQSITIRLQVDVLGSGITWAEAGIGTASAIAISGNASISRVGFTNIASVITTTGEKSITIALTGVTPGQHLWFLIGQQSSTMAQFSAHDGDELSTGFMQSAVATRISTMAVPTSFAAITNAGGVYFAYAWT